MKKTNKIIAIVAMMLAVCCIALCAVSCKKDEDGNGDGAGTTACTSHTDANSDGNCDTCGKTVEVPCDHADKDYDGKCDACNKDYSVSVNYTVTLKDEDGNAVSSATVYLYREGKPVASAVTGEDGVAKGTVNAGIYQINVEGLPQYWTSDASFVEIEINESKNAFSYTAVDNTPDGSVENPFPAENAETGEGTTVKIPAGVSYIFTTKGSSRYLVIKNANVKVSYNDADYLPADGEVRVFIEAAADTTTATLFTVTNTSAAEIEITVNFEAIPGSPDNPFNAVTGEKLTASVPAEGMVYYRYTAEKTGILMLMSETAVNNIMMYNTTNYVVTAYTNGALCDYIYVTAGDVVDITVALTSQAPASDVEFILNCYTGAADDPIPVYASASLRFLAGASYCLEFKGENKNISVSASGVSLEFNGAAQTADGGKYTVAVTNGDIIKITNTASERADITVTVY